MVCARAPTQSKLTGWYFCNGIDSCQGHSPLAFGIVGRFGGSSVGFVVTALNAALAASREVVVLRVLSADILRTDIFGGDMVATRTYNYEGRP
jgi:hypothetical protein